MKSFQKKGFFNAIPPPTQNKKFIPNSTIFQFSKEENNKEDNTKRNNRKVVQSESNYFDEDDDEIENNNLTGIANSAKEDQDYDPLDDFMAGIEDQVKKQESQIGKVASLPEIVSRTDEIDDDEDGNYVPIGKKSMDSDDYDSDDIMNHPNRKPGDKAKIEPLPPVDHSTIHYLPFRKQLYHESTSVSALTEDQVSAFRDEEDIHISFSSSSICPRPIKSFSEAGFDSLLLKEIEKLGYEKPTAIQSQAIPIALSGFDLIGLAKTGSGKTFAYLLPMISHILDQPQLQYGDGPIGLVLCPTRELATQIYSECKKFSNIYKIRVCVIYGGAGKWEMTKALKESPEIVISTPGRLIEMVKCKASHLSRCTMVVLDEADRMFEMGFEYQMRSIVNNIRPDKQMLMFSATMKKKIEGFAREMLQNEIRISIGTIGQANPDIRQLVEIVHNDDEKWLWLSQRIDEFAAEGKVLIFVLSKIGTEELSLKIRRLFAMRELDIGVDCLHGDKDQNDRLRIMSRYKMNHHHHPSSHDNSTTSSNTKDKSHEIRILIATDIASRGLDVSNIRTVINYDIAKNIETYVHRIGRTGRMGVEGITPGTAYTLVTPKETSFAVDLVQNLNLSSQPVNKDLQKLAEKDPKWSKIRHIKSSNAQRQGLGSTASTNKLAMTSAMLASESKMLGHGNTISVPISNGFQSVQGNGDSFSQRDPSGSSGGDYNANPYIEGHSIGRGKHLTVASWANPTGSETASNIKAHDSKPTQSEEGSEQKTVPKRRNRFSMLNDPDTTPSGGVSKENKILRGFVRATVSGNEYDGSTLSSVTSTASSLVSNTIQQNIENPINKIKKSRWE